MNYITALLITGMFLLFTACSGDDGSSNKNSGEPINKEDIRNTDSSQVLDQDNNEPQAPKDVMQAVTDALQAALDKNNVNNADIETSFEPYNYPNGDPYNNPNSDSYNDPNG